LKTAKTAKKGVFRMEILDTELRSRLLASDPEFRQLTELHQKYDAEIRVIESAEHLTPIDLDTEYRLKKLKLQCKDRMEMILQSAYDRPPMQAIH
jgi:uncharacterized protein YdcH (DUF465 family)